MKQELLSPRIKEFLNLGGIEFFEWVETDDKKIIFRTEIKPPIETLVAIQEELPITLVWEKLIIARGGAVKYHPESLPTACEDIKAGEAVRFRPDGQISKAKASLFDNVNHPPHYNQGKIEVIEFIEDKQLGFHLGNTVKYVARAGKKDPSKEIEDLQKAQWYLTRRIEFLKALKDGRETIKPNNMVTK